jgi:hypothetical protein
MLCEILTCVGACHELRHISIQPVMGMPAVGQLLLTIAAGHSSYPTIAIPPPGTWKGGDKELSSLFANALNLAGRDPAEQVGKSMCRRVQPLFLYMDSSVHSRASCRSVVRW